MKNLTHTSSGSRPRRLFTIRRIALVLLCAALSAAPSPGSALTLDEALSLAKANLPSYQAEMKRVEKAEALQKASLGTYIPRIDLSGARANHDASAGSYDSNSYDATLSYTLFEGFQGMAGRDIASYNLEIEREELSKQAMDLAFGVKQVFYRTLALKEIEETRHLQLEDAKKDYEAAEGRYRLGVVTRSDLLQASVRREQAQFNLSNAGGNLRKAVAELYSLLGVAHDASYDLEGHMEDRVPLPDRELLAARVLERPEIRQAEQALKKSESEASQTRGEFWPTVSADLSYSREEDSGLYDEDYTDKRARIVATWNLFDFGKFYRDRSSRAGIEVAEANQRELKRQLMLDFQINFEDFVTALNNIAVARRQLAQAEQNYNQAFGEYKVGKGDIVSLVVAEDLLAGARQQMVTSRLTLMIAKSQLERAAGLDRLDALNAAPSPSGGTSPQAEDQ